MSKRARGLLIVAAVLVGAMVVVFAVALKPFQIPSEAMEPTFSPGDRILVNRLSGDPSIGDVVVIHPPDGADPGGMACGVERKPTQLCPEGTDEPSDQKFIKRIVAGPEDELYIKDGHPVVNGEMADEDFIRECRGGSSCNFPDPITVPADHYFMLGDNRGASDDSRFWGPVPEDWIVGKVVLTYWPPGDVGSP
ncbi:MAG: signal peptidase I [Actinomycetota bacterium]|nr:signal peptidase I [Actinomycetota bacterium]